MSNGYMGNTSICREFVKNKRAEFSCCTDDWILSCSTCAEVLLNEPDTMLVVDGETNKKIQCIHCYSKTVGITTTTTTTTTTTHLRSPPTSIPTTPSAPRARNTSDVSETECAADAANAVASFSAVMDQQQQQQFQASAAMLTCDGLYQNQLHPT
jgi:hypothetical protein